MSITTSYSYRNNEVTSATQPDGSEINNIYDSNNARQIDSSYSIVENGDNTSQPGAGNNYSYDNYGNVADTKTEIFTSAGELNSSSPYIETYPQRRMKQETTVSTKPRNANRWIRTEPVRGACEEWFRTGKEQAFYLITPRGTLLIRDRFTTKNYVGIKLQSE